MVKRMTFNHSYGSSNLLGLKINGYRLIGRLVAFQAMCTDSNSVGRIHVNYLLKSIRVSNLIGKGLSCRESRYRIVADIARL